MTKEKELVHGIMCTAPFQVQDMPALIYRTCDHYQIAIWIVRTQRLFQTVASSVIHGNMVNVFVSSVRGRVASEEEQVSRAQFGGADVPVGNDFAGTLQVRRHGGSRRSPGGDSAQEAGVAAVGAEYQGTAVIIARSHPSCLAVG